MALEIHSMNPELRVVLPTALAVCAIVALVFGADTAQAQQTVPALRQASILTRALAYDRNMKERAGDSVSVGVLYRPGNSASESCSNDLLQAFRGLEKFAVHGLPFKAVRIAYDGVASLRDALRTEGIDAVYACPGLDNDIDTIAGLAQERKFITMGAREDYVTRTLTIGVFVVDNKPTILLNWGESQKEGAAFSSDLVRLSKVINDAGR